MTGFVDFLTVVLEVVHKQSPHSYCHILIKVQSIFSTFNFVKVDVSQSDRRLLVSIDRVFVVEADNGSSGRESPLRLKLLYN